MKKFENRIIVGEVMAKSLVSCFFDSRCRNLHRPRCVALKFHVFLSRHAVYVDFIFIVKLVNLFVLVPDILILVKQIFSFHNGLR